MLRELEKKRHFKNFTQRLCPNCFWEEIVMGVGVKNEAAAFTILTVHNRRFVSSKCFWIKSSSVNYWFAIVSNDSCWFRRFVFNFIHISWGIHYCNTHTSHVNKCICLKQLKAYNFTCTRQKNVFSLVKIYIYWWHVFL